MVSSLRQEMLTNLMNTVIENAGAQKSFLILPSKPEPEPDKEDVDWLIEAEGAVDADEVIVLQSVPVDDINKDRKIPLLPNSVINYVVLTKKNLVLNDAKNEGGFTQDPYIVATHPKSILCTPLIHEEKLSGILYLENNLTTNAFTVEHINVLNILSAPVAISIENSRLVVAKNRELRDKNKKLEQALKDLKTTQNQIIAQEKLASLGTLTGGIAHEIKNPLVYINGFAEVSEKLTKKMLSEILNKQSNLDGEIKEYLDKNLRQLNQNVQKINVHGKRADKLVRTMLEKFRGEAGKRQLTDINDLLRDAVNLAYHGMRAKDTSFNMNIQENYDESLEKINIIPQNIFRAFLNIINNACMAVHKHESNSKNKIDKFSPTLLVSTKNQQDKVEIRIRDNGVGIAEEIRDRIFDPFFTTKPPGKGTGLGLWISHNIIAQEHQGKIEVESEVNKYTEFIITLPKNVSN